MIKRIRMLRFKHPDPTFRFSRKKTASAASRTAGAVFPDGLHIVHDLILAAQRRCRDVGTDFAGAFAAVQFEACAPCQGASVSFPKAIRTIFILTSPSQKRIISL